MHIEPMNDLERKAVAVEYLKRVDCGEGLFELFDDHAHVYFQKWGLAKGHLVIHKSRDGPTLPENPVCFQ